MKNEPFSIPGGEDLTVKEISGTGKAARIIFNDELMEGAVEAVRKFKSDTDDAALTFHSGSGANLKEPGKTIAWRALIAPMIPKVAVKVNYVGKVGHNSKFETEITCCGVRLIVEADHGVRKNINPGATFHQFGEVVLDLPEDNFHVVRDGLNAMKISAFEEWAFYLCMAADLNTITAEPNP